MRPLRIHIIDDHPLLREGIRAYLQASPGFEVVGESSTAIQAMETCPITKPDVAIVDLFLPDQLGIELVRSLKSSQPQTQILLLTSTTDRTFVIPALKAGATSYLVKDCSPLMLLQAIRFTAKGEGVIWNGELGDELTPIRPKLKPYGYDDLSEREIEVFEKIALGLSNAEIADSLFIGQKTVKTHVSNILNKLGLSDRTQVAVLAWRSGLMKASESSAYGE